MLPPSAQTDTRNGHADGASYGGVATAPRKHLNRNGTQAAAVTALLVLAACGLLATSGCVIFYDDSYEVPNGADADTGDAGDVDGDTSTGPANACGGQGPVTLENVEVSPGQECGCGGIVVCNGATSAVCVGEFKRNSCGGCDALQGTLNEPCGPCGNGAWRCVGSNAVACSNVGPTNQCGGCDDLGQLPDQPCVAEGDVDGTTRCVSPNDIQCIPDAAANVCGGTLPLANGEPLEECAGACNNGVRECIAIGANATRCVAGPLNGCGGCAELPDYLGEPCGPCGAVWSCGDDMESVVCDAPALNACGGCGLLAGQPGDSCVATGTDEHILVCATRESVQCRPAATSNACGGGRGLAVEPGETCGDGDGIVICVAPDQTECLDYSPTSSP